MTLQQLKYFIETVYHRSINRAAEALFIAQHYAFAVNAFVNMVKKTDA